MTETRRLLFVLACVVCLLTVVSALPAADPRLETPGGTDDAPAAGGWETITEGSDPAERATETGDDDTDDTGDDESDAVDEVSQEIEIDGALEPGNEIRVEIDDVPHFAGRTVEVNGEDVTETNSFGRTTVEVPYAEEMNVTVPEINESKTVAVETDATLEADDGAAPDRDLEVAAAVGSTPVENGTVYLEDEAVATTDADGSADVTLPESAGPAELRVERGPVASERTVDVAEPNVEFATSLLFPGSPAPVQVSADGVGVPNATVSLESGEEVQTGEDGLARLWLPLDDEAIVTAEVGAETTTATVGNLYLRLTALAVLVPGLAVGATVTYLQFAAAYERRRGERLPGLFVGLAGAFTVLFDGSWWPSRPRLNRSLSLPRVAAGVPSFDLSLPSVGRLFATLPSLGSITSSSDRSVRSVFGRGDDGTEDGGTTAGRTTDDTDVPGLAPERLEPRGPRAEVRAAWHAFLDRLDLEDRETRTPGEAARHALAAGFPAAGVRRLVRVVRDLEYGDREPSPDRVATAREATDELLEHEPDEEGDE
ncbi:DUF4129 domain-containing protein [Natronococcus pandeyae]|uniref:DUF4129 domain-containing protein n=1 Tax=Natronococcus pandeyae TaxID=2055836 RepID=A0A8J8Q4A4_9EURY|nr:DUF4129 domain-containing protein [Natronococcus pandeyae]TYL40040.1 DUF4129 domain-containing protein [Natronococcus pandeyae]